MISRYERELDYIKMDLDYYKKKLDEQQIATQMEIADLENQLEVAKFKSESGFFEGNIMGVYVLLGFIFVRFFVLGWCIKKFTFSELWLKVVNRTHW